MGSPAFGKVTGHYQVLASKNAEVLTVEARFDKPVPRGFTLRADGREFVDSKGWEKPCVKAPCIVSYRFRLAEAARKLADPEVLGEADGVVLTTPTAWLVRPIDGQDDEESEVQVKTESPTVFATGLPRTKEGTYRFRGTFADDLSPALFGPGRTQVLDVGGARIDLVIAPRAFRMSDTEILAWVRRSADAVTAYFGRFPVEHLMIYVRTRAGDGRGSGMTLGYGGAAIFAPLKLDATPADMAVDWVLPHEMTHLAMPNLARRHHWAEEGLATYVEPLARVRSGELRAEDVWTDMLKGMPQGLPEPGDEGLDHTATWGRTYWGGALFYLKADVELRRASQGRFGLEDALRGVLANGGSILESSSIEDVFRTADAATGSKIMIPLYEKWKDKPVSEDLPALWRALGVELKNGVAHFDDEAPEAAVRRAITFGWQSPKKKP